MLDEPNKLALFHDSILFLFYFPPYDIVWREINMLHSVLISPLFSGLNV